MSHPLLPEPNTPNFYAIIPATVRYNKNLEPGAKLLYGEITALCNQQGYCWAANKYFSELYDVDARTIQRWLRSLKDSDLVFIEVEIGGFQTSRKIWISKEIKEMFTERQKCQGGGTKMSGGSAENVAHNNTPNITDTKSPIVPKGDPPPLPSVPKRKKVIEEKKEVAPRVFLTPSQEESIKMRLEGSTIDLSEVYDKLSVWKINKGVEGGKNDFKAICDWVIESIKEKKKKELTKPQDPTKENEALAKKVITKFKKEVALGRMSLSYNYIDFTLGQNYEKMSFSEYGFKDKIFNRLRKMNLPIDGF